MIIDPIDGSTNAKRGLPHHSLSIAVADGPTMADVFFAYVYDFGPQEEWTARRGGGAWLDGVTLDRDAGEQRSADGRLELLGIESSDPRLILAAGQELADAAHRLRALGTIAVTLCQVAAARLDAMVSLRRCRAVDAAAGQLIVREAGGSVAFTSCERPARRAARPSRRTRHSSPHAPPTRSTASAVSSPEGCSSQPIERPSAAVTSVVGVIDWRLAERVSRAVTANTGPRADPPAAFAAEVESFAARSAELVSAYTGLQAVGTLPVPETVDRAEWSEINLGSMRSVLEPLVERQGEGLGPLGAPLRALTGMVLAVEVGGLSGFLASRVLGQYEFPVTDPDREARLLFVGPNLAGAARALEAGDEDLVRWVALHETTHALQFGGVEWLRSHMAERITGLLASMTLEVDARSLLRLPNPDDLRAFADAVRSGRLVDFVAGPERRVLLDELQATMALIEGYAEHVMDAVGESLLPELPRLREGLERRRKERTGLMRLFERMIGLDLKLRQYEQGKAFCDAVVAAGGIEALNRAWVAPGALPTLAELDDPNAWLERTANDRSHL